MQAAKVRNFDMQQISVSNSQSIDFDRVIKEEKIKIKSSRRKEKPRAKTKEATQSVEDETNV